MSEIWNRAKSGYPTVLQRFHKGFLRELLQLLFRKLLQQFFFNSLHENHLGKWVDFFRNFSSDFFENSCRDSSKNSQRDSLKDFFKYSSWNSFGNSSRASFGIRNTLEIPSSIHHLAISLVISSGIISGITPKIVRFQELQPYCSGSFAKFSRN